MPTTSDDGNQRKNSIPVAFHNYRQFISVKLTIRPDGKTDKIPCDSFGRKIDAHDPKNWITMAEALSRPFGVGFVFTSSDSFWFIDLDNAIVNQKLSDLAQKTLDRFPGAAWEVSTSGTGIHIFGSGRAPEHKSVKSLPAGKIEFYDWGRFVLIPPGDVYGDASIDFTPQLAAFVEDYGLTPDQAPRIETAGPVPGSTGWQYTDAELIEVLQRMKGAEQSFGGGVTAWDLWTGNATVLATRWPEPGRADGASFDRSSADAGLFTHLCFLTGKDYARADRLFRQSALYRADKYEGKGFYRLERLIAFADRVVTKVYNVPKQPHGAYDGDPYAAARANAAASWEIGAPVLPPPPVVILPPAVPIGEMVSVEPPRREWTVSGLIPHKQVTLLSGDGGTGKTTLLLQLGIAAASMRPWLGQLVEPRRVLFISGEDELDDLHYRVHEISKAMNATSGNMWVMSLEECVPAEIVSAAKRDDVLAKTALFTYIGETVKRLSISMLILDPVADIFGGDEINKRQVKQFIALLRRDFAIPYSCTVLIAAHPSVDAMKTGRGYSGSTAWNNSVRSRLYFTKHDDKSENSPMVLQHHKSNRSQLAGDISVHWTKGIFVLQDEVTNHDNVKEIFMRILQKRNDQGRQVSDSPRSGNYAPKVFADDPDACGISENNFKKVMNELFDEDRIFAHKRGTGHHTSKEIWIKSQ